MAGFFEKFYQRARSKKKQPHIHEYDVESICYALTATKFCSVVSCRRCPFRSKEKFIEWLRGVQG